MTMHRSRSPTGCSTQHCCLTGAPTLLLACTSRASEPPDNAYPHWENSQNPHLFTSMSVHPCLTCFPADRLLSNPQPTNPHNT